MEMQSIVMLIWYFYDILQTEVFIYVLVFAIYLICRGLCDFVCLRATQGGKINKKIRRSKSLIIKIYCVPLHHHRGLFDLFISTIVDL